MEVLNTQSIRTISNTSEALAATFAQNLPGLKSVGGNTQPQCLTISTALDYLTGWLQRLLGATVQQPENSKTTGVVALTLPWNGGGTGRDFYNMCRHFQDGMIRPWKWIELITTAIMNPVISDFAPLLTTGSTGERSLSFKPKLPVYDILSAGPKNRFMIHTDRGPLIVHNCILGLGYGCGVDRFFAMVLSQARQAGLELGSMFTYTTADRTVDIYRNTYWEIPDLWRQLDRWLPTLNYGPEHAALGPRAWREDFHEGQWVTRRYDKTNLLVIKKGAIVLPNAMELRYNVPDTKIYGAKLLENIIQALARIVVMQAALRLSERGQRFCLQVHDELVFIVPTEEVDTVKEIILAEMIRQPTWAPGLPLAAEVGVGKSYGDCKT